MPFQVQSSAPPPAKKTAGLIEKETLKKRISNNEYRMLNVEGMYSIFFNKEMERSDSILRNSLFVIRYSAVRCLIQAIAAASLITKKTCHFGLVSYERRRWPEKRPV
jgi:hypothetical protein